jgi:hypothetical protein
MTLAVKDFVNGFKSTLTPFMTHTKSRLCLWGCAIQEKVDPATSHQEKNARPFGITKYCHFYLKSSSPY